MNDNLTRLEKKQKRSKWILYIALVLLLIFVIIAVSKRLNFFNIKNIEVEGINHLNNEELLKKSSIKKGVNIFSFSANKEKNKMKQNPYVVDLSIKRKLPATIIIKVKEKEAKFKILDANKNIILDKHGVILGLVNSQEGEKLLALEGLKLKEKPSSKDVNKDIFKFVESKDFKEFVEADKDIGVLNKFTRADLSSANISLTTYDNKVVEFGKIYDTKYRYKLLDEIFEYIRSNNIVYEKIIMNKGENPIIVRTNEEG